MFEMKRLDYYYIYSELLKEGYRLLTPRYKNNKQLLKYICSYGHINYLTWDRWLRGDRCVECNKLKKQREIKLKIIKILKAKGFKVLSIKKYKNDYKIACICSNSHLIIRNWYRWKGEYCTKCNSSINVEFIKEEFSKEGYTLLTTEYINSKQKLDYICKNGHRSSISWNKWKSGRRCPYCAGKVKLSLEYIRKEFLKEGYILLNTVYKNSNQYLHYICPNKHKHKITWKNWLGGVRCPYCYGNIKKDIKFISDELKKEGYTLLSSIYKNNKSKLKVKCNNGHVFTTTWDAWNHFGRRCRICKSRLNSSSQEDFIYKILKSILDDNIIRHDRKLIYPKELDFVIPSKKVAIEYCGLYWHSDEILHDRYYHKTKLLHCLKNNYLLITIFEDELFNKFESVLSFLCKVLCDSIEYVNLSKCNINKLNYSKTYEFFDKYYLGYYDLLGYNFFGIYYDDTLISVFGIKNDLCIVCEKPFWYINYKDLEHFIGLDVYYVFDGRWPLYNVDNLNLRGPRRWFFNYNGHYINRSIKCPENMKGTIWDCGTILVKGGR